MNCFIANSIKKAFLVAFLLPLFSLSAQASEDDDEMTLWLSFPKTHVAENNSHDMRGLEGLDEMQTATAEIALSEIAENWEGLPVTLQIIADTIHQKGYFKIEKRENDMLEGPQDSPDRIYITANDASGLIYGAYFILRSQSMGDGCLCKTLGNEDTLEQEPAYPKRYVETDISMLSETVSLENLARLFASIGINGIVLSGKSIKKIDEFSRIFNPYQIELFSDIATTDLFTIDIRQTNPNYLQFQAPLWQIPLPSSNTQHLTPNPQHPSFSNPHHPSPNTQTTSSSPGGNEGGLFLFTHLTTQPFTSANLYAYGRKVWMPQISNERVAFEWLAQSFSENPLFVIPMRDVLIKSASPSQEDFESFISIWHQMRKVIDPDVHSAVEECLNQQYQDFLDR